MFTGTIVNEEEWDGLKVKTDLTGKVRLVKEAFFYFAQLTPFPAVVLKKETALRIGGFKSELHPIADYDFWYRYSTTEKMLMVNQLMAFYRISPTQSTNHLIDAMINNIYSYRLRLIKNGKYNNILSRLTLESSRLTNIRFFKDTYPDIKMPDHITNQSNMERARKLLRNRILRKIVRTYQEWVSFGKP